MTGDAMDDVAALPATLPAAIRVAASRWPDRIPLALHAELERRWGTGCLGHPVGYKKVQVTDADGRPVPAGQPGAAVTAGLRGGRGGRVYYAGRLKDMIRRSGENMAAREVEEVLPAPFPEKFSRGPGYPARAGGPWLWRTLVLSTLQARCDSMSVMTCMSPR